MDQDNAGLNTYCGAYCVISPTVDANGVPRTWLKTKEEAEQHARSIITAAYDRGKNKTKRLFVVQVIEVVELPGPTIVTRAPTLEDVTSQVQPYVAPTSQATRRRRVAVEETLGQVIFGDDDHYQS